MYLSDFFLSTYPADTFIVMQQLLTFFSFVFDIHVRANIV